MLLLAVFKSILQPWSELTTNYLVFNCFFALITLNLNKVSNKVKFNYNHHLLPKHQNEISGAAYVLQQFTDHLGHSWLSLAIIECLKEKSKSDCQEWLAYFGSKCPANGYVTTSGTCAEGTSVSTSVSSTVHRLAIQVNGIFAFASSSVCLRFTWLGRNFYSPACFNLILK